MSRYIFIQYNRLLSLLRNHVSTCLPTMRLSQFKKKKKKLKKPKVTEQLYSASSSVAVEFINSSGLQLSFLGTGVCFVFSTVES